MLEGALKGKTCCRLFTNSTRKITGKTGKLAKGKPGIGHVLTIDGLAEEYKNSDWREVKEIDFKVKT